MVKHFIAVSSLYSQGLRIAWHYTAEKIDQKIIQDFLEMVKKKQGEIQLGVHMVTTDSLSWDSVVKSDGYFSDIIVYADKESFISLITEDQALTALDVAKFILSIKPVSHLKLQKLLYFSYEKFIRLAGEKLFDDKIYAWKHGPVIETVYDAFKSYGSTDIESQDDTEVMIHSSELIAPASFAKIFTSEHGMLAIDTIQSIVNDYAIATAWDLVELTHKEGTPWEKVFKPGQNKLITDEIIISYS